MAVMNRGFANGLPSAPALRFKRPSVPFTPRVRLPMRMILAENRFPSPIRSGTGFFGIMRLSLRMILSENRFPLFGIMR